MNTTEILSNKNGRAYYYGWSTLSNIRGSSSSGGLFYSFASYAIQNGGVAFGAAFQQDGYLYLQSAATMDKLKNLLGSKYVQCRAEEVYKTVKEYCADGKRVVFCSTPCQCNALLRYMRGHHPDNLLIMDFICHGVPGESVWKSYLDYRTQGKAATDISFRDKRISWGDYGMRIAYGQAEEYFCRHQEDPFMRLFLANRILRPSCHRCRAKGENRVADITLGDFWGIDGEREAKAGCSVMMTRTENGEKWCSKVCGDFSLQEISLERAIRNNSNYLQSCGIPFQRTKVLRLAEQNPTELFEHVGEYVCTSFAEKVIRKVIRETRKMKGRILKEKDVCYLELEEGKRHSFEARAACCGCGACAAICPKQAIAMKMDEEGFRYPVIDQGNCVKCGLCEKICKSKMI